MKLVFPVVLSPSSSAWLQNKDFPPLLLLWPLAETHHPCFHLTAAAAKGLILVAPILIGAFFIELLIYC